MMAVAIDTRNARFDFVSAAHRLLFTILPFRWPHSYDALNAFVAATTHIRASPFDVETVLLRCLDVLSRRATHRVPSLVDQYLFGRSSEPADVARFAHCVERALRFDAIADGVVQDAVQLVRDRFGTSACSAPFVAATLGTRLSTLDVAIKAHLGCTLTEYIRDVRLERASKRLATSNSSIKEILAEVGYAHHSNFDHDFKRRYHASPREYRARSLRPAARELYDAAIPVPAEPTARNGPNAHGSRRVLIIDGGQGTQSCVRDFLHAEGHAVFVTTTSEDARSLATSVSLDVILLEYRLHDSDGIEVLRRFRQHLSDTTTKALIFTADWDAYTRADELNALNASIVSKLCDPEHIRDLLVS